jgi:hypothetical protein
VGDLPGQPEDQTNLRTIMETELSCLPPSPAQAKVQFDAWRSLPGLGKSYHSLQPEADTWHCSSGLSRPPPVCWWPLVPGICFLRFTRLWRTIRTCRSSFRSPSVSLPRRGRHSFRDSVGVHSEDSASVIRRSAFVSEAWQLGVATPAPAELSHRHRLDQPRAWRFSGSDGCPAVCVAERHSQQALLNSLPRCR